MKMPSDPNILASMLNMKLRDNENESLEEICDNENLDVYEVIDILGKAGFKYNESIRQFR